MIFSPHYSSKKIKLCLYVFIVGFTLQATPKLSEDKVKQCIDARLQDQYPPKAVAKVNILGGK